MSSRCLTFMIVPGAERRLVLHRNIPYNVDDLAAYLASLKSIGYAGLREQNELFFRTIGRQSEDFMQETGMAYRFIVFTRGGVTDFGKTVLHHPSMGEVFRGSMGQSDMFLRVFAQSDEWKRTHMADLVAEYMTTGYRYMPDEASARAGFRIPPSKRGLSPDYRLVEETIYPPNGKPLIYNNNPEYANVSITLMGDHDAEVALANKAAQIAGRTAPELYVWHHLDDFDPLTGKCTMQLVLEEFHRNKVYGDVVRHVGGSGLYRKFYFLMRDPR